MHIHDQHHLVALDNRNSQKISPLYSMAIVSVVGKGYPHNANSRNEGVTQCWSEQQLERTAVPRTNCTTPNLSLLNRHVPRAPAAALPARPAPGGATCPGPRLRLCPLGRPRARHVPGAPAVALPALPAPGAPRVRGPGTTALPARPALGAPRVRGPGYGFARSASPGRAMCPGPRLRLCPTRPAPGAPRVQGPGRGSAHSAGPGAATCGVNGT